VSALRFLVALAGAFAAWLWVRGARDPAEWPKRIPEEIELLRRDIAASIAAGLRAGERADEAFQAERALLEAAEYRSRVVGARTRVHEARPLVKAKGLVERARRGPG
jgi:hypothetical protein